MTKVCLASDNYTAAHPHIMQALVEANQGISQAYGEDHWTKKAEDLIQKAILKQPPAEVLQNLKSIQDQVEEAKNWCDGVLLQLSKAIEEASAIVCTPKKSFIESIISLFEATKGKKNDAS